MTLLLILLNPAKRKPNNVRAMNKKILSVHAPNDAWTKAREMGGGNASAGFRKAIELAYPLWAKQQQQKWNDRARKGAANGNNEN